MFHLLVDPFVFTDRNIQVAVDDWIENETDATTTYGDIKTWDVSRVTNMAGLFQFKETFNADISGWDVSSVTNMNGMFFFAPVFNQDISGWNVSSVTDMTSMLSLATAFNQEISTWDVSSVTRMTSMFNLAPSFNQDINRWNVSSVDRMESMFVGATAFNGDISGWDVSRVANMQQMFIRATAFNQDISGWDVSKVTNMIGMFDSATAFKQDISRWDVSKVTLLDGMFRKASAFNQNLCAWGRKLPFGENDFKSNRFFEDSGCPVQDDPNFEIAIPGPLCFACLQGGNAMNIGVADVANTLDSRPVSIDVASNDFVRVESAPSQMMMGIPGMSSDLPIRPRGPGGTFTITRGITTPSNGVFSINTNPDGVDTITYSPNPGYAGEDTFGYLFDTGADDDFEPMSTDEPSDEVLVTVTVGAITAPANFLGTSNQQISTEQALDFVNGPFNDLFPGLRGQSPAEAAVAASSTAVSKSGRSDRIASLFNLFNLN
jgi:surface protein